MYHVQSDGGEAYNPVERCDNQSYDFKGIFGVYGFGFSAGLDYQIPRTPFNIALDWAPRFKWTRGKYTETLRYKGHDKNWGGIYLSLRVVPLKQWFKNKHQ